MSKVLETRIQDSKYTQWDVVYGDGVITFSNPNTTLGFVRYTCEGEIEYIFVNPLYRRKGIATSLLDEVRTQTGISKLVPQEPISPLGRLLFRLQGDTQQ